MSDNDEDKPKPEDDKAKVLAENQRFSYSLAMFPTGNEETIETVQLPRSKSDGKESVNIIEEIITNGWNINIKKVSKVEAKTAVEQVKAKVDLQKEPENNLHNNVNNYNKDLKEFIYPYGVKTQHTCNLNEQQVADITRAVKEAVREEFQQSRVDRNVATTCTATSPITVPHSDNPRHTDQDCRCCFRDCYCKCHSRNLREGTGFQSSGRQRRKRKQKLENDRNHGDTKDHFHTDVNITDSGTDNTLKDSEVEETMSDDISLLKQRTQKIKTPLQNVKRSKVCKLPTVTNSPCPSLSSDEESEPRCPKRDKIGSIKESDTDEKALHVLNNLSSESESQSKKNTDSCDRKLLLVCEAPSDPQRSSSRISSDEECDPRIHKRENPLLLDEELEPKRSWSTHGKEKSTYTFDWDSVIGSANESDTYTKAMNVEHNLSSESESQSEKKANASDKEHAFAIKRRHKNAQPARVQNSELHNKLMDSSVVKETVAVIIHRTDGQDKNYDDEKGRPYMPKSSQLAHVGVSDLKKDPLATTDKVTVIISDPEDDKDITYPYTIGRFHVHVVVLADEHRPSQMSLEINDKSQTNTIMHPAENNEGVGSTWDDALHTKNEVLMLELLDNEILPEQIHCQRAFELQRKKDLSSETFDTICEKICAHIKTKSDKIGSICASYTASKPERMVFVVKADEGVELNVNYAVKICHPTGYSKEGEDVTYHPDQQMCSINVEEITTTVQEHSTNLFKSHSNIQMVAGCSLKSRGYGGTDWTVSEQPCIVIYVNVKGVIPMYEESLPNTLEIPGTDKGLPVDVREGGVQCFTPPDKYHTTLRMGCQIGEKTGDAGTLGVVIEKNDKTFCLTCAHVFFKNHDFMDTIQKGEVYSSNGTGEIKVFQGNMEEPFGVVVGAIFRPGNNRQAGLDVAVIEITDTKRVPQDGRFPDGYMESLGFSNDNPMIYSSGKVYSKTEFDEQVKRNTDVVKYGCETGYTKGTIDVRGPCVVKLDFPAKYGVIDSTLHNQLVVLSHYDPDKKPFADHGDSGSLVFAKHGGEMTDLRAIGIVEGGTSSKTTVVTPIWDIMDYLKMNDGLKPFVAPPLQRVESGYFSPNGIAPQRPSIEEREQERSQELAAHFHENEQNIRQLNEQVESMQKEQKVLTAGINAISDVTKQQEKNMTRLNDQQQQQQSVMSNMAAMIQSMMENQKTMHEKQETTNKAILDLMRKQNLTANQSVQEGN